MSVAYIKKKSTHHSCCHSNHIWRDFSYFPVLCVAIPMLRDGFFMELSGTKKDNDQKLKASKSGTWKGITTYLLDCGGAKHAFI